MRTLTALLVLSALATPVLAGPSYSAATVKIRSAPCADPGLAKQASGLLFQRQGKAYVVTSQSALFHSSTGFCHDVFTQKLAHNAATLLAVDWGSGLALLEVPGLVPGTDLPADKDLHGQSAPVGDPVTVSGYLVDQDQPYVDNAGSVLLSGGNRHSIPTLSRSVEIQGSRLESGMVGGPVEGKTGQFYGLVSQQYLKMVPGSSTRPHEWLQKAGEFQTHGIVLPASHVRTWIDRYFIAPAVFEVPYHVEAGDQLKDFVQVGSGPLKFLLSCPLPTADPGTGGPIGGGDGVGVGGSASVAPFCSASLGTESPTKTVWPFPQLQAWVDDVSQILAQGRKLELKYFLTRASSNGILVRVPIWSLSDLFTQLQRASLTPVLFKALLPGEIPPDGNLAAIRADAEGSLPLAKTMFAFLDIAAIQIAMREVYLIAEVLGTEQWQMVTKADVDSVMDLQGRHQQAWDTLLQYQKQSADELRLRLGRIHARLPR